MRVADPADIGHCVPMAAQVVHALEAELPAVVGRQTLLGAGEVALGLVLGELVLGHPFAPQLATTARVQPAELATKLHAALGHDPRGQGGVVVRREVEVDRLPPVEAVAAGHADRRPQQTGAAPVVDREHQPRDVQHRYLADAHRRVAGDAQAFGGIDVDALRAQLPRPLRRRAGGVGGADQRALVAFQLDPFGSAVAASPGQLVAQVLDDVGVGFLVAMCALGDDAHAGILVAHAAFGDVGAFLAVVGQLVGAEELVAAAELDVALEHRAVFLGRVERVAGDVGRQGGAILFRDRVRHRNVGERRYGVLYRAEPPVLDVFGRVCRKGHRDAQR